MKISHYDDHDGHLVCDRCVVVAAERFAGLIVMIMYALRDLLDLLALSILIVILFMIIWFVIAVQ